MKKEDKKAKNLWLILIIVILLLSIIVVVSFLEFTPRKVLINNVLNERIESGISLDLSYEDYYVKDYYRRRGVMYVKLELSSDVYYYIKQKLLLFEGTVSSEEFTTLISREDTSYHYDSERFESELLRLKNSQRSGRYNSMNLVDYKEIFIIETWYPKAVFLGGTTGISKYVLVSELNGGYFLYYIRV